MILNLDRWIVSSIQRQASFSANLWITLPRLVLALILGAVISEPLVLRVFNDEIIDELSMMQQERQAEFASTLREDPRYSVLPSMETRASQLQEVIAGSAESNAVIRDPEVQEIQKRLDDVRSRYDKAEGDVVCEKEGKCGSGKIGAGIAYREKVNIRDRLYRELQQAEEVLKTTKDRLYETTKNEMQDAKKSAAAELDGPNGLKNRIQKLRAEKDKALASFVNNNVGNTGLLARMEALSRLTERRTALSTAYVMLFLVIVAMESLPTLAKFLMSSLGGPNVYDRLLELHEQDIFDESRSETEVRDQARKVAGSLTVHAAITGHDLEKDATERITRRVVDSQVQLAEMIVDAWKEREEQRVKDNLDDFLREDDAVGVRLEVVK